MNGRNRRSSQQIFVSSAPVIGPKFGGSLSSRYDMSLCGTRKENRVVGQMREHGLLWHNGFCAGRAGYEQFYFSLFAKELSSPNEETRGCLVHRILSKRGYLRTILLFHHSICQTWKDLCEEFIIGRKMLELEIRERPGFGRKGGR